MSTAPSRRLATLFVAAVSGVLLVLGLVISRAGWAALASYLLVVVVGLVLTARRARALRRPAEGRTCTCCTSTVFDPVEVR